MGRLNFEFCGTKSTPMSIDPTEYKGLSVPRITSAILQQLRSISPGVDFFEQDIELAAIEIKEVNGN
jgi:hypothetical protein